jgi:GNAT superfamily N-acetyltransferase
LTAPPTSEIFPAMEKIDIKPLGLDDAHQLAPLVAAYTQDRKRGAPRVPDEYYAELLLRDRTAELIGARLGGRLVGFAVFFDLPDTMTGMRAGQLDDIFVLQDDRHRGIGKALVDALAAEGRKRGWARIRWMVPEKPPEARALAERLGERGGFATYAVPV